MPVARLKPEDNLHFIKQNFKAFLVTRRLFCMAHYLHIVAVMRTLCLLIFLIILDLSTLAYAQEQRTSSFTSQLSSQQQEFIVSFKAYISALIHAQSAETKKRLTCLGFRQSEILNPTGSDSLDQLLDAYQNSEECQRFLTEGIQQLFTDYSRMRVNLALYLGRNDEIYNITVQPSSMGQGGGLLWLCSRMDNTLFYGDTNFCFRQLRTILDSQPTHIIKKSSWSLIDRLVSRDEVAVVADLPPLMWEEVVQATQIFHQKFTEGTHMAEQNILELEQDYDSQLLESLSLPQLRHQDDVLNYHRDQRMTAARMAHYFNAADFQASGVYVFSDYPEDSAPARYVDILTRNPVLAFFEPVMEERQLECTDPRWSPLNLQPLCEAYLDSLRPNLWSRPMAPQSLSRRRADINQAFINAYLKVLETNQTLLEELELNYQDETLFNYERDHNGFFRAQFDGDIHGQLEGWEELISMDAALRSFLREFPEFNGVEAAFVSRHNSQEFWRMMGMVGIAIGVSVPCGFLGPKGFLACLLATGLTANGLFYVDSLHRHDRTLTRFFATSQHDGPDSLQMSLVDFASYRSEVQALYIDSLFLWVGIGGVPIARQGFRSLKDQLHRLPQLRRGR
jgi:hypothetical protein